LIRKLQEKVLGKPIGIPTHLFVEPFGGHTLKSGQVGVEQNPLAANLKNARCYSFGRFDGLFSP
jgi:hypothetical protein